MTDNTTHGTSKKLFPNTATQPKKDQPKKEPQGIYEDVEFAYDDRRNPSLPYVVINMVSSVDGKVQVDGKTSGIGSRTDRGAMRELRSRADAVMIGAGTLRAEKLSLGLGAKSRHPQPLAVILTAGGGEVPLENLVREDGQKLLVVEATEAPEEGLCTTRNPGKLDAQAMWAPNPAGAASLAPVLKKLAAEHGVEILLVEGGPTLNHALVSEGLADELFLTLAPKLLGGDPYDPAPTTIVRGAPFTNPPRLRLISVHKATDELFLRYSLNPTCPDRI